MHWKDSLEKLERHKQWDAAIEYMEHVIADNQSDMEAYLSITYVLMNLLAEEDYDVTKHDYYAMLAKKYFDESYEKFSNNPEYLFYIARIAAMSEWYFDIEPEDIEKMLQKAAALDPKNPLYQWSSYSNLEKDYLQNKHLLITYSQLILQNNSPIKMYLESKGSLGRYIWNMMEHWAKRMLDEGYFHHGK